MANTIEPTRHSSSQKSLFVENAAVVGLSTGSAAFVISKCYKCNEINSNYRFNENRSYYDNCFWNSRFYSR